MNTARPILIVQHEDACPPGWLGDTWAAHGMALDVRTPYRAGEPPDQLPGGLDRYAALVVLGGAMGANDDAENDWLAPTKAFLRDAVAADLPTLGVCLGHQLMAVALGGRAGLNPAGQASGVTPIALTPDGAKDPLLADLDGRHVVQWNSDVITEMPFGATVLATAPDGSVQAARFGARAWGLQFHPEASPQIFDVWAGSKPTATPGAGAAAATDVRARADVLREVNGVLARRFLRLVALEAGAGAASDARRGAPRAHGAPSSVTTSRASGS